MKCFIQVLITVSALVMLVAAPLTVLAASHEAGGHGGHGSHQPMEGMQHGGHGDEKVAAGMIMLGEQTVEGVKAMAHLNDVKAAMAKMGMKETHHFMVMFQDAAGKTITTGTVAVKIKSPGGKEGEPIALPGMQEHFGADITLADKGIYEFKVGSKLADGKARQYEFKYEVK